MADLIIETGQIVDGANTYVGTSEFQNYLDDRNITVSGDLSELLIQAMDYLESLSYIGIKRNKDQNLQWPRCYVYIDGYCFPNDEIPKELKQAQMATAVSIDEGNGPLAVVERATRKETVGPISVEYLDSASSTNTVRTINASLWKLLSGSNGKVIKA